MKNRILTIIALLIVVSVNAQVLTNKGQTIRNNGALITTVGGGIDNEGTIENNGVINIDGSYIAKSGAAILRNMSDTVYINGQYDNKIGLYDGSGAFTGTLAFDGAGVQIIEPNANSGDNTYRVVVSEGGIKRLSGTLIVENDLRLENGVIFTNSTDTLGIGPSGEVSGSPGVGSHVDGALFRVGKNSISDLFFPIGKGGDYRPATFKDLPIGSPVKPTISFEVINSATGGTAGMGVENLVNTRYWVGSVIEGDYGGAKLELSYGGAEGALDQTQLVVAQSATIAGTYKSIDQSAVTANSVTSEFEAHDGYYVIGESANLRVNINAYLEGAYSGGTMRDSLFSGAYGNILAANYENGNAGSNNYGIDMLNKYAVPNPGVKPVDVVRLTIRDVASPTVDIDETFAWLMSDGSIRDFGSGMKPFATFTDLSLNTTTNYALVVWHRNHVPLMFEITGKTITQSTAAPVMFDVTNPLNIYSVGYKDLGAGDAGLYIGNAEQAFTPLEVNAFDLFVVGNDAKNNLLNSDLYDTDVNLSGETNATDWDKTKWANDQLYYATLP